MTQSENNLIYLGYENNQGDCLWNVETVSLHPMLLPYWDAQGCALLSAR